MDFIEREKEYVLRAGGLSLGGGGSLQQLQQVVGLIARALAALAACTPLLPAAHLPPPSTFATALQTSPGCTRWVGGWGRRDQAGQHTGTGAAAAADGRAPTAPPPLLPLVPFVRPLCNPPNSPH